MLKSLHLVRSRRTLQRKDFTKVRLLGSNPVTWSEQTFFAEQRTTKLTPAFFGYFYPEKQNIRPPSSLFDRSLAGFSLLLQYFRCFCPCGHEKTLICLVDKLAFFYVKERPNCTFYIESTTKLYIHLMVSSRDIRFC